MSSPAARKPIRIVSEESPDTFLRWRVRTEDGQVRGPLSKEGLKALVEVGLLTPAATIALEATEEWLPFSDHAFWAEMKPRKREFSLQDERAQAAVMTSASAAEYVPSGENRWVQRERAATIQREKTLRMFRILRFVNILRGIREVLILAVFVIIGDLAASVFTGSLEIARWMAAFGMIATALMYYIFRALHD